MPSSIDEITQLFEAQTINENISTERSHVYLKYDLASPPPHPGDGWTRFVCISDTHSHTFPVPNGDVLIHAGDLSSWGMVDQMETTMKWIRAMPHPVKLVIAGNHDDVLDMKMFNEGRNRGDARLDDIKVGRDMLCGSKAQNSGIQYLEYARTNIPGSKWRVYGSPGSPWFSAGAFQYNKREAKGINALIPNDTQILITHTPPYGILDRTKMGAHAGCRWLSTRFEVPSVSNPSLPPAHVDVVPSTQPSKVTSPPSNHNIEASTANAREKTPPSPRSHRHHHSHPHAPPSLPAHKSTSNDKSKPSPQSHHDKTNDNHHDSYDYLAYHCRLHVFGHIHEARGAAIKRFSHPLRHLPHSAFSSLAPQQMEDWFETETVFVNAAGRHRGTLAVIVDLKNLNM